MTKTVPSAVDRWRCFLINGMKGVTSVSNKAEHKVHVLFLEETFIFIVSVF